MDQSRALKRKRNKEENTIVKQEVLETALRKEVRGGVDTQLANELVEQLKGSASLGVVADLFGQLSASDRKARTAENKRRAETRAEESNKKKRTEHPHRTS